MHLILFYLNNLIFLILDINNLVFLILLKNLHLIYFCLRWIFYVLFYVMFLLMLFCRLSLLYNLILLIILIILWTKSNLFLKHEMLRSLFNICHLYFYHLLINHLYFLYLTYHFYQIFLYVVKFHLHSYDNIFSIFISLYLLPFFIFIRLLEFLDVLKISM